MLLRRVRGFVLAALAMAVPVAAQPGVENGGEFVASPIDAGSEGSDDIVVIGDNGNAFRLTADSLRDAARAYRENRSSYAPLAQLYFAVEAGDGGPLDGLSLYLRARRRGDDGNRDVVELPLDDQRRFVLPMDVMASGGWDLRANVSRGGIRIRPLVLSPDSTIADRRFGDLRLQCRVSIAFARLSLPLRMLAGAAGVCNNGNISLLTRAPRALVDVTLSDYGDPIEISEDRIAYRVPLHDERISNEARMRHVYR